MDKAGTDRMDALYTSIDVVREAARSRSAASTAERRPAAAADHVRQAAAGPDGAGQRAPLERRHPAAADRDDDPLGVDDFATHRLPLSDAAAAYEQFQKKTDGTVKVLFQP
jgi:hypothetical protein